ncbi:FxsA family protein [Gilvimarinus polysaccharolyticus]|uniref:FxsA family protein n=1 Tax=Gilvimarinus polysaccharolyticus TaxID=863921 RepID=UPI0006733213|nr:FxsA family protein [Gilvimarinus polysaccharolyticus]
MPIFLSLFIIIPLLEIGLFIQVGSRIGVLPTVALVVLTAVFGVLLLRWQGFTTLMRARGRMQQGQMPAREMVEGIMLAFAGAMLLTPGFFTDALGFLLLIPACRHALFNSLGKRMMIGSLYAAPGGVGPRPSAGGDVYDGEFRRTDNASNDTLPPKK